MESQRQTIYLVVAALLRRDEEVLLVSQKGPDDDRAYWALPGGVVEPEEALTTALAREVGEEVGLRVLDPGRLAFLTQTPTSITFTFEVAEWDGQLRPADPDDLVMEARFFSVEVAIDKLAELPVSSMREPVVSYLRGALAPGTIWTEQA
jgi:8-oxo-dGTP diphosphatase